MASEKETGAINSLMNYAFDERGRMWPWKPSTIRTRSRTRSPATTASSSSRIPTAITWWTSRPSSPPPQHPPRHRANSRGRGGGHGPHVILFEDKNGDDKADQPQGKILYTGFTKGDTHGAITHLRYGLDNWLYGDIGYNGGWSRA